MGKKWKKNKASNEGKFEETPASVELENVNISGKKDSEASICPETNPSESWKPKNETDNSSYTDTTSNVSRIINKEDINRLCGEASNNVSSTTLVDNVQPTTQFDNVQTTIPFHNVQPTTSKPAKIKILSNVSVTSQIIETSRRKGRVWDKRDRCPYCDKDITNFSRHIFRNHSTEESVTKILEYPTGSRDRKKLIDLLRKQGNFSIYSQVIRPVQRPTSDPTKILISSDKFTYLPCKYCQGLYKKKSLCQHAKTCFFNTQKDHSNIRYPSEGQTILAFTESKQKFLNHLRLKTEVFNTMRADEISVTGKKDPLICQFAEDYLRKHKRAHIKNRISNKIRELGRLLIKLKEIYNIHSMLDALKPQNFDKVVAVARIISGYNEEIKGFQSPSLAIHLRTSLLAVCSAAQTLILKKDPILPIADYYKSLKEIKNFYMLVNANWKFGMGSLALKDLNEKHSTKPQTLPIGQDIILFKNHCHAVATDAMNKLRDCYENIDAFKNLSETTLALTILINRKRVGDVEYMKLTTYTESPTNISSKVECLSVLTEAEKVLTQHFKRVMVIGKGSKSIPILFPKKIQEYLQVLLDMREHTSIIPEENPYLFAAVGSTKWLDGSSTCENMQHLVVQSIQEH